MDRGTIHDGDMAAWSFPLALVVAACVAIEAAIGDMDAGEVATALRLATSDEEVSAVVARGRALCVGAERADIEALFAVAEDVSVGLAARSGALDLALMAPGVDVLDLGFESVAGWAGAIPAAYTTTPPGYLPPKDPDAPQIERRLLHKFLLLAAEHPAVGEVRLNPNVEAVMASAIRTEGFATQSSVMAALIRRLNLDPGQRAVLCLELVEYHPVGEFFSEQIPIFLGDAERERLRALVRASPTLDGDVYYNAVSALASLGDPPGVEEVRRLRARIPRDSTNWTPERFDWLIRCGQARQSVHGMLSLLSKAEKPLPSLDWVFRSLIELKAERSAVRSALGAFKSAMRRQIRPGNGHDGEFAIEYRLRVVKALAIGFGFLTPRDWPDVAELTEERHKRMVEKLVRSAGESGVSEPPPAWLHQIRSFPADSGDPNPFLKALERLSE